MNCELIYGTECNPFTGECYTALIPGSIPVSAPHDPLRVSRSPAAPGLLDLT